MAAGITVAAGAADGFHAPFAKPAFDARLLFIPIPAGSSGNADGRDGELLITYTCSSCERRLTWAHLKVTADATPDGGLLNLRAWAVRTVDAIAPTATFDTPGYSWGGGRNQAFFAAARRAIPDAPLGRGAAAVPGPSGNKQSAVVDQGLELLVQPWIGLVASFGTLQLSHAAAPIRCRRSHARQFQSADGVLGARCALVQQRAWKDWDWRLEKALRRTGRAVIDKPIPGGVELCGSMPLGTVLRMRTMRTTDSVDTAHRRAVGQAVTLLLNETSRLKQALDVCRVPPLAIDPPAGCDKARRSGAIGGDSDGVTTVTSRGSCSTQHWGGTP